MNYNKSDFVIEKSTRKDKKYVAHLKKDPTKKVHFGGIKKDGSIYPQYHDSTPLKLYKSYDHNDPKRKERYEQSHKKDIKKGFNAGYLSSIFLW